MSGLVCSGLAWWWSGTVGVVAVTRAAAVVRLVEHHS